MHFFGSVFYSLGHESGWWSEMARLYCVVMLVCGAYCMTKNSLLCVAANQCCCAKVAIVCSVKVGHLPDPSWNTDQGVQHVCKSKGPTKPGGAMKVKVYANKLRWDPENFGGKAHHRPACLFFWKDAEQEHTCCDPKDGDLCLCRLKPEETLVEDRSGSDVQIDRQTWV